MEPMTIAASTVPTIGAGMIARFAVNTVSDWMKMNHQQQMALRAQAAGLEVDRFQKLVGGGEKFTDVGSKRTRRIIVLALTGAILYVLLWSVISKVNMMIMVPEEVTRSSFWSLILPFASATKTYVRVDIVGSILFSVLKMWELGFGYYIVGSNK